MLDVEAIRGLGPESEENETVEDGRHGKGKIPVAEKFGAKPQEEDTRDGGQEDVEGHCRVVQETFFFGERREEFREKPSANHSTHQIKEETKSISNTHPHR